jgi:hypothetical protein
MAMGWHWPPMHVPPRQSWLHAPQFLGSPLRSTQLLQSVLVPVQAHLPLWQVLPPLHAKLAPQPPQLLVSFW